MTKRPKRTKSKAARRRKRYTFWDRTSDVWRTRRFTKASRRRALELLAEEDCTENLMLAAGFTIPQIMNLVNAGLATVTRRDVSAGGKTREVTDLQITDAGRKSLARAKHRKRAPQRRKAKTSSQVRKPHTKKSAARPRTFEK